MLEFLNHRTRDGMTRSSSLKIELHWIYLHMAAVSLWQSNTPDSDRSRVLTKVSSIVAGRGPHAYT